MGSANGATDGVLLFVLRGLPAVQPDIEHPDWAGWSELHWRRTVVEDPVAPIINLFTPEFLTHYVTFAARRPVERSLVHREPDGSDSEADPTSLGFEIRIRSLDVVAIGSYQPEWIVVLRLGTDDAASPEDLAIAMNTLAKSHLPTFNRSPCFEWDEDGSPAVSMTPFEVLIGLLNEFAPRGVAEAFEDGVVDSRAKVIGFAPHSGPEVRSEGAVRSALGLAGGVHSVSGINIDRVFENGHAVPIDLFNNWTGACTLDGVGIVFDPDDDFASIEFRDQVLEAYWLVYADAISDVASVDRFLRRPILDLRRRRELLGELTEFGQLNRQWSSRGANAFPVAAAIRRGVEHLHSLDQRLILAQRRADSISSGVIAVANHRFNKVLILVAVLTAGNVVQALTSDTGWWSPVPLAVFFALIVVIVLVFDARPRTILVTLLAGSVSGAGLLSLAALLLPGTFLVPEILLVCSVVCLVVASMSATFYRDR